MCIRDRCYTDESQKMETLKKNKDILNWLEANMNEINAILDM